MLLIYEISAEIENVQTLLNSIHVQIQRENSSLFLHY